MRDRLIDLEDEITMGEYRDLEKTYINWNKLKEYIENEMIKNAKWYQEQLGSHDKQYYFKDYDVKATTLEKTLSKIKELESEKI